MFRTLTLVLSRGNVQVTTADLDVDRAAVVGSPGSDASSLELIQDGRVRVAEKVPPAAGNDRQPRLHGLEETRPGRAPAPVVCDLDDIRPEVAVGERDFSLGLDVPGQENPALPALDA